MFFKEEIYLYFIRTYIYEYILIDRYRQGQILKTTNCSPVLIHLRFSHAKKKKCKTSNKILETSFHIFNIRKPLMVHFSIIN